MRISFSLTVLYSFRTKNLIVIFVRYEPPQKITLIASEHLLSTNETEIDIDFIDSSSNAGSSHSFGKPLARADIPAEAFGNISLPVTSLLYRENTLLQEVDVEGQPVQTRLVSSSVLSIRVGDKPVTRLSTPLVLRFQRTYSYEGVTGDDLCSFWNFTARMFFFLISFLMFHSTWCVYE